MRSRVRTGSRPEVTIWILEPCAKYPSGYLWCQTIAGHGAVGSAFRDGASEPVWRCGQARAVARGAGRAARAARLGVSSVLGGEALALDVAPELLGHLGGSDRRGAEQRLQAVRATPEADRVAAKRGLLAGRSLRHLLLLDRKIERLPP